MTTYTTIVTNLDVTPEQIGAAHLVLHKDGNFYQVESSQDCTVEYAVRYSKATGFTCDCKSGQHGFSNVKHASGVCWHVRAAIACSLEVKAALAEQERHQAEARATVQPAMYTSVDAETLARVLAAKPAPVKRVALPKSRPFQLMR